MAIPPNASRYAAQSTVSVPGPDGEPVTLGVPRVAVEPRLGGRYQVRPGDRLDLMALAALADSTRWWVLADANPWFDPGRLEDAGRTIELPDA